MRQLMTNHWSGDLFCKTVQAERANLVSVNISFGCHEVFQKGNCGTGNFIGLLYSTRLQSLVLRNVDLHFECHDAKAQKKELVLPWLTGRFPPRDREFHGSSANLTVGQVCRPGTKPISLMYKEIQYDLRRMAVGLVGILPGHPSATFADQNLWSEQRQPTASILQLAIPQRNDRPLFSPVELDDAVIHFRCGDLMVSDDTFYGFLKFSGYTKYISLDARSIGILTQPFETSSQSRPGDSGNEKRRRCRIACLSLVEYIQERFPSSKIHIHNGPNETIALAYARMVMANQTIVGLSSFGVFPVIASFGTGYIVKPDFDRGPNRWLLRNPRIDQLTDSVVLIEEPERIVAREMNKMWKTYGEEGVLAWFWNETLPSAARE